MRQSKSGPSIHVNEFPPPDQRVLRVFCPDRETVVTTFESYLPSPSGRPITSSPELPARLCWFKEHLEYYAFLPRDHSFHGHLLAPLNRHTPETIYKDGRWFIDEKTQEIWRSLDTNITKSIDTVGTDLLFELQHFEPEKAVRYGFTRGHRSYQGLRTSLGISRKAFIHRLAYFVYLVALRYNWDEAFVGQSWWRLLRENCSPAWVDSIWDMVYKQWKTRNFIGMVIRPSSCSVRWVTSALKFGVPIWVTFPGPEAYKEQDGSFHMTKWKATPAQVKESREVERAKFSALQATCSTAPPLPDDHPGHIHSTPEPPGSTNGPTSPPASNSLIPPTVVPEGGRWYESWENFFQKRREGDAKRLETASEAEKKAWQSREQRAKTLSPPGSSGAKVYIWESCESGGFFRILQTRFEVARDWEYYLKEALTFHAQSNVWDHCPFMWEPAVEQGPPDDLDDDDTGYVMEHWYTEPDSPASLPDLRPPALDFLYQRYGFLSTQPHDPPLVILPFTKAVVYSIVGLPNDHPDTLPPHLNSFVSSILGGQRPAGHCDLDSGVPPLEMFPPPSKALIHQMVFYSEFLELSEDVVFTMLNAPHDPHLLVVHNSLSVLQMVRVQTQPQLESQLQYLLSSGCQFTLLYPEAQSPISPHFDILTIPIREEGWRPRVEDFPAYMSRLKTFLLERPWVAAAAFSRGGIAWRLAREVLGIEGSTEILLNTRPTPGIPLNTAVGSRWFHKPHEGEWFYLVGGYEVLTGKGDQRLDLSWWPKVTLFEGGGLNVGCWTPLCEQWFRNRLQALRDGNAQPYSATQWQKNMRFRKEVKKFFPSSKKMGRVFLMEDCNTPDLCSPGIILHAALSRIKTSQIYAFLSPLPLRQFMMQADGDNHATLRRSTRRHVPNINGRGMEPLTIHEATQERGRIGQPSEEPTGFGNGAQVFTVRQLWAEAIGIVPSDTANADVPHGVGVENGGDVREVQRRSPATSSMSVSSLFANLFANGGNISERLGSPEDPSVDGPANVLATSQTATLRSETPEVPLFEPEEFEPRESNLPSQSDEDWDTAEQRPPPSSPLPLLDEDDQDAQVVHELRERFQWFVRLLAENQRKRWGTGYRDFADVLLLLQTVEGLGMVEQGNGRISDGEFSARTGTYKLTLMTFIDVMELGHSPATWRNKLTMYFRIKTLYLYSQHNGGIIHFRNPGYQAAWDILRVWAENRTHFLAENWQTSRYGTTELRTLVREMAREVHGGSDIEYSAGTTI